MRAATIDNVTIGGSWAPVLDHSCARDSGHGPLALTLDYETESPRYVHVTAEVAWSTVRGRAVVEVDVPCVLNLGAMCVAVRGRAHGADLGDSVSISAQLVASATAVSTRPTFSERILRRSLRSVRRTPRWARWLNTRGGDLFSGPSTWIELYGDELAADLITRNRMVAPIEISPAERFYRVVDSAADLQLVWTLNL